MFNLDDITNENNESHNKKWPYIPDHPYTAYMDNVYNNIDDYNPNRNRKNFSCVWWYDCWYYDQ